MGETRTNRGNSNQNADEQKQFKFNRIIVGEFPRAKSSCLQQTKKFESKPQQAAYSGNCRIHPESSEIPKCPFRKCANEYQAVNASNDIPTNSQQRSFNTTGLSYCQRLPPDIPPRPVGRSRLEFQKHKYRYKNKCQNFQCLFHQSNIPSYYTCACNTVAGARQNNPIMCHANNGFCGAGCLKNSHVQHAYQTPVTVDEFQKCSSKFSNYSLNVLKQNNTFSAVQCGDKTNKSACGCSATAPQPIADWNPGRETHSFQPPKSSQSSPVNLYVNICNVSFDNCTIPRQKCPCSCCCSPNNPSFLYCNRCFRNCGCCGRLPENWYTCSNYCPCCSRNDYYRRSTFNHTANWSGNEYSRCFMRTHFESPENCKFEYMRYMTSGVHDETDTRTYYPNILPNSHKPEEYLSNTASCWPTNQYHDTESHYTYIPSQSSANIADSCETDEHPNESEAPTVEYEIDASTGRKRKPRQKFENMWTAAEENLIRILTSYPGFSGRSACNYVRVNRAKTKHAKLAEKLKLELSTHSEETLCRSTISPTTSANDDGTNEKDDENQETDSNLWTSFIRRSRNQ